MKSVQRFINYITVYFNPSYLDGLSHIYRYNTFGLSIVYFKGTKVILFLNLMFFCPLRLF